MRGDVVRAVFSWGWAVHQERQKSVRLLRGGWFMPGLRDLNRDAIRDLGGGCLRHRRTRPNGCSAVTR